MGTSMLSDQLKANKKQDNKVVKNNRLLFFMGALC